MKPTVSSRHAGRRRMTDAEGTHQRYRVGAVMFAVRVVTGTVPVDAEQFTLSAFGLVSRSPHPTDGRVAWIELTPAGKEISALPFSAMAEQMTNLVLRLRAKKFRCSATFPTHPRERLTQIRKNTPDVGLVAPGHDTMTS